MRPLPVVLVLICATALVAACGSSKGAANRGDNESAMAVEKSGATAGSPGCGRPSLTGPLPSAVTIDGIERSYRVYVPASYRLDRPAALVFNFHGFGGIAVDQEDYAGVVGAANEHGFIAVTPDGSGEPQRWSVGGEASRAGAAPTDDFAFVRRMIDGVSATYCVDPSRVYAAGISNGGFFSSYLACQLNDTIAAIALVAGEAFPADRCSGKRPVPVIAFHGTDDRNNLFEGRTAASPTGRSSLPARETIALWAKFNGCEPTMRSERVAADVVRESYGACLAGADVQLYVVEGGGHNWPDAPDVDFLGRTTHSINATALMWRFFTAHPKS